MSTATAAASVQAHYDAFTPQPLRNVTAQRMADEQGPKCSRCNRPSRVPSGAGGCGCPRFWNEDGTDATLVVRKSLEERYVEATEGIFRALTALAKSMNVEIPAAPEAPAATPPPVGVGPNPAAVEAIRHADQQRRKVS